MLRSCWLKTNFPTDWTEADITEAILKAAEDARKNADTGVAKWDEDKGEFVGTGKCLVIAGDWVLKKDGKVHITHVNPRVK